MSKLISVKKINFLIGLFNGNGLKVHRVLNLRIRTL